jgi:hypothetical protein
MDRTGIAGTLSVLVSGTTGANGPLDLHESGATGLIQLDREIYEDIPANGGTFDGTTGTGSGTRAARPMTCTTGVVYFSTDQGSWNSSGSGGQGVLDKCTSTNTWTNAVYVPFTYPYPGTVTDCSAPDHLAFISQPSDAGVGASLGTVSVGVYDSTDVLCGTDTSTVSLSKHSGATWGTLSSSSSLSKAASSGVATWSDLSIDTAGSGSIDADDGSLTGTTSNPITISSCIPDHLAFIDQPHDATLGAAIGLVSVGVYDASDVLCSSDSGRNISLHATVNDTWTLASATDLTHLDSGGISSWTDGDLTAIMLAGVDSVTATSSGLTGTISNSITISAASGTGGGRLRIFR